MTANDWIDIDVVEKLQEMVGRDVVREIIDLFLLHAPRRLGAARRAGGSGDLDTVARELHSLKSSAGSIGALRLQQLAAETEKLAMEGREEPVRERLDELAGMLDHVVARLTELLAGETK